MPPRIIITNDNIRSLVEDYMDNKNSLPKFKKNKHMGCKKCYRYEFFI